jgi:hypothetical protein
LIDRAEIDAGGLNTPAEVIARIARMPMLAWKAQDVAAHAAGKDEGRSLAQVYGLQSQSHAATGESGELSRASPTQVRSLTRNQSAFDRLL